MRRFLICLMALTFPFSALAVEMGDDGLHKPDWLRLTFKDLAEDLSDANAEGKRLMIIVEQRGCMYCTKMHKEVFPSPEIEAIIQEKFFVVQMNLFGDTEVTDFDGTTLPEREMALRWGVVFTPTMIFLPESPPTGGNAAVGASMIVPGAFGKETTRDMLTFVFEKRTKMDEHFQHYHARMFNARRAANN